MTVLPADLVPALLAGGAGAIIGSFVAALTWRWPRGDSIIAGRSRCDGCGAVLAPFELVPILSFAVLRGRCRRCRAAIAPRHLAIELAATGIGMAALLVSPGLAGLLGAAFGWGLLALVVLDVEHFWLPDRIVVPLGLAGLAAALLVPPAIGDRLIGVAAGFAVLAGIGAGYRAITGRAGLGGGDPKLFAAIGAWLGWAVLPFVLLGAALLGLALAGVDRARGRAVTRHSRVPLGAMLGAAAWLAWLAGGVALPG